MSIIITLSSPLLSSPLLSSPLLSSPLVAKFHTEKHLPFLSTLTAKQWTKIAMEKVLLILTPLPCIMSTCLSLSLHYLQIVQNVLCQPDGLPVHYICSQILESAWAQYVVKEKAKRGIADKVSYLSPLLSPLPLLFHLFLSLPPSFLFPSLPPSLFCSISYLSLSLPPFSSLLSFSSIPPDGTHL